MNEIMFIVGIVIGWFILPSLFLYYKQRMNAVAAILKASLDCLLLLIVVAFILIKTIGE